MKRIKGFPTYCIDKEGNVYKIWSKNRRLVTPQERKDGYVRVRLSKKGVRYCKMLHRLLAETYIPNLNNGEEVDHINNIRNDNRLENLQWLSRKENNRKRKYVKSILCFKEGKFIKEYECARDCSVDGFNYRNVSKVCRGERKTHLGHTFKFKEVI